MIKNTEYGVLEGLSAEELEALAKLKGTIVERALRTYFKNREMYLLKDIKVLNFAPSTKTSETLFWLQDVQSKLTEGVHLLGIFDKANELFMKLQKGN